MADHQVQFDRSVFSNVYLTLIGVIQGGVFAALAGGLLEEIKPQAAFPLNAAAFARINAIHVLYLCASLLSVIVITIKYSYFVALLYRRLRGADIAVPFVLGLAELLPVYASSEPRNWWLFNSVLCFVAFITFLNSLSYPIREIFHDHPRVANVLLKNLRTYVVQISVAVVYCAAIGFGFFTYSFSMQQQLLALGVYFCIGAVTLTKYRVGFDHQTGAPVVLRAYHSPKL